MRAGRIGQLARLGRWRSGYLIGMSKGAALPLTSNANGLNLTLTQKATTCRCKQS